MWFRITALAVALISLVALLAIPGGASGVPSVSLAEGEKAVEAGYSDLMFRTRESDNDFHSWGQAFTAEQSRLVYVEALGDREALATLTVEGIVENRGWTGPHGYEWIEGRSKEDSSSVDVWVTVGGQELEMQDAAVEFSFHGEPGSPEFQRPVATIRSDRFQIRQRRSALADSLSAW